MNLWRLFFLLIGGCLFALCNDSIGAGVQQDTQEQTRTWSDKSGEFKIEAILIEAGESEVKLQRADNQQVISVSLDQLSKSDIEYLAEFKKLEVRGSSEILVDNEPWLIKSNWVTHHVVMKGSLTIPANRQLKMLQFRHALPTPRNWTGGDAKVQGATNVVFSPESGNQKYDRKFESHYVIHELKKGIEPGTSHEFVTSFDVLTCDREFDPAKSTTTWEDYGKPKKKRQPTQLTEDLKKWVAGLKENHTPAETVAEFCKWNAENMTYDAGVSVPTSNVATFLGMRRGHCGHYCSLMAEFCDEAGIPTRSVFGLNLYAENGIGELSQIRSDYTNVHTWIEVYLPKEGWIEMEPAEKEKPFLAPARFIQNNPEIQNYMLAFNINGQNLIHNYTPSGLGRYRSEYGFENLITYSSTPAESPFAQPGNGDK